MKAGNAVVDVTPEESVPIAGMGPGKRFSTGVHDPVFSRALVLDDGATTVGLAALDLLWVSKELVAAVTARLEESDVPLDDLWLSATHTHNAPWVPVSIDDHEAGLEFHFASNGFTRENAAPFTDRLDERVAESLIRAYDARERATLRVGRVENDVNAINRRSDGGVMGEIEFPPSVEHRRDPHEDIDPELLVLLVQGDDEETVVANYASHVHSLGGTELSADIPGIVADRVATERDATTLFLTGAAGDIQNHHPERDGGDSREEYMQAVGDALAESVLEATADAEANAPMTGARIRTDQRTVDLDLRSIDSNAIRTVLRNRVTAIEGEMARDGIAVDNPLTDPDPGSPVREKLYLERLLALDRWDRDRLRAPVQYVQVGTLGLLGLPFEPFVAHGIEFKGAAAVETPMVAGYTNGYLGYLPTTEEFDYGGYAVETSPVTRSAVEHLRRDVFDLVT